MGSWIRILMKTYADLKHWVRLILLSSKCKKTSSQARPLRSKDARNTSSVITGPFLQPSQVSDVRTLLTSDDRVQRASLPSCFPLTFLYLIFVHPLVILYIFYSYTYTGILQCCAEPTFLAGAGAAPNWGIRRHLLIY